MSSDPPREIPPSAAADLMPLVYDELRQLARSYLGGDASRRTMQATALVSEAYLKVADQSQVAGYSRKEFLRFAARVMRNVLMDEIRAKQARKRGGDWQRITLTAVSDSGSIIDFDILALDEALDILAKLNERKARLVELRFFGVR